MGRICCMYICAGMRRWFACNYAEAADGEVRITLLHGGGPVDRMQVADPSV